VKEIIISGPEIIKTFVHSGPYGPPYQCPFNSVQVKVREGSPERIRMTMDERICERDEF